MNPRPIHVLLIEDNPDDVFFIELMLTEASKSKASFESISTKRLSTGLKYLAESQIDILLLDLSLPDSHGLKSFSKAQAHAPDVPIIVLISSDDEALATKAMQEGAQDYLVKGQFDHQLLARSIRYAIERQQIMRELERAKEIDVVQHKKAEQALEENEERVRSIFLSLDDLLFVLDKEGRFLDFYQPDDSDRLYLAPEHFLGKHFKEVLPPDVAKLTQEAINKVVATHEVQEFDYAMNIGGKKIWSNVKISIRRNRHKQFTGVTIHSRNITEQKRAEAELEEAKKAAEAANRAKSEFLANMSHELRTPLNTILGYAQIMQDDQQHLNAFQKKGLSIIERSGAHLLTLINDILDLSSIEVGHMELYPTEFNLPHFLKNLVEMFDLRATEKGLLFRFDQLTFLPVTVMADEKRLRQILINLLGNAIKFTEQGGIRFTVGIHATENKQSENNRPLDRSGWQIRFQIEDTGIGIPADHLTEIFNPFRQITNKDRLVEGTGLGLTISQRLAHMMGSTIKVKSSEGQGSLFWLDVELESQLWPDPAAISPPVIAGSSPLSADVVPPPAEDIAILYDLAMRDDIPGILPQLSQIELMDDAFAPFAIKLHQFANNYQINQITELMENTRQVTYRTLSTMAI